MALWMVEQWWKVGGGSAPVRSVVEAETEEEAFAGAPAAIEAAVTVLAGPPSQGTRGEPIRDPVVLYLIEE